MGFLNKARVVKFAKSKGVQNVSEFVKESEQRTSEDIEKRASEKEVE